jgi:hypothetical protein
MRHTINFIKKKKKYFTYYFIKIEKEKKIKILLINFF